MMIQCWHPDPAYRLKFSVLVKALDQMLEAGQPSTYIDLNFSATNPFWTTDETSLVSESDSKAGFALPTFALDTNIPVIQEEENAKNDNDFDDVFLPDAFPTDDGGYLDPARIVGASVMKEDKAGYLEPETIA